VLELLHLVIDLTHKVLKHVELLQGIKLWLPFPLVLLERYLIMLRASLPLVPLIDKFKDFEERADPFLCLDESIFGTFLESLPLEPLFVFFFREFRFNCFAQRVLHS